MKLVQLNKYILSIQNIVLIKLLQEVTLWKKANGSHLFAHFTGGRFGGKKSKEKFFLKRSFLLLLRPVS